MHQPHHLGFEILYSQHAHVAKTPKNKAELPTLMIEEVS